MCAMIGGMWIALGLVSMSSIAAMVFTQRVAADTAERLMKTYSASINLVAETMAKGVTDAVRSLTVSADGVSAMSPGFAYENDDNAEAVRVAVDSSDEYLPDPDNWLESRLAGDEPVAF